MLLLTFGISFVRIGLSASNEAASARKKTTVLMNASVNKGQQFQDGNIDGALNPEMIPDRIAYTILFRVLDIAEEATDLEKERASSFAGSAGLRAKTPTDC